MRRLSSYAAGALSLTAAACELAAGVARRAAHLIGPDRRPAPSPEPSMEELAPHFDASIAADRPAAQVVEAVEGLTHEELAALHAYESEHQNRRTVLRAIERATAP